MKGNAFVVDSETLLDWRRKNQGDDWSYTITHYFQIIFLKNS